MLPLEGNLRYFCGERNERRLLIGLPSFAPNWWLPLNNTRDQMMSRSRLKLILLCFCHRWLVSSRMFAGWFSKQNWTKKVCFIGKSTSTSKLFFPSAFYKFNDFAFGFITALQVSPSVSIEPLPNNVIQSRCFGNMGCPHLLHRAIEDKQLFLAPKTWCLKVDPKMR